jgi:hypothetical protein
MVEEQSKQVKSAKTKTTVYPVKFVLMALVDSTRDREDKGELIGRKVFAHYITIDWVRSEPIECNKEGSRPNADIASNTSPAVLLARLRIENKVAWSELRGRAQLKFEV